MYMKVEITHKDKLLFPKDKISKEDLAKYYARVAKQMLPLIRDRPISMLRFPDGINKIGFFQKRAPETTPKWIRTAKVKRKTEGPIPMILCQEKDALIWLANQNCITPHIWLSKIDKPDLPDRMIFDLDPPTKKEFPAVVEAALLLKEILEKKTKCKAFVMTTGSKGLHVVVPIQRKLPFDALRAIARQIAEELVKKDPKKFTMETRKNKRRGRVYIDVLRNGFAQTSVAPYAVRALPGAPVATPLFWKELQDKKLRSDFYTLRTIGARLQKNPWKGIEKSAKSVKSF